MIKLSILMVRRSDLTYEDFIKHWGEVHGPLFAAQSEAKRYVRRYIHRGAGSSHARPRVFRPTLRSICAQARIWASRPA
jgi:EthD domain